MLTAIRRKSKKTRTFYVIILLFAVFAISCSNVHQKRDPDLSDALEQFWIACKTVVKAIIYIVIVILLLVGSLLCFVCAFVGLIFDILVSIIISLTSLRYNFITPISNGFRLAGIYLYQLIPYMSEYFWG